MIKFGTSGFRAVMGEEFTKENVQRIMFGVCEYAKKKNIKNGKIAIGFDNRFMGEMYAKWAIEVLALQFNVKFFISSVPTPVISFETYNCDFGVMVTSSHNPFYYNGIKLFGQGANELADDVTAEICEYANSVNYQDIQTIKYCEALEKGKVEKTEDISAYVNSILKLVDENALNGSKIKILINTMHGSGYNALKQIVDKLNLKKVDFINENVDPTFENSSPAPYPRNLTKQAQLVVDEHYDCGFAIDGDADRFTFIDSTGEIYDCGYVAPIIYEYLVTVKGKKGAFVRNSAFSNLSTKIVEKLNEEMVITKVGFKCIGEEFAKRECVLGSETNGIAIKEHVGSKDGVVVCAVLIDMLSYYGKTFGEILKERQEELNFKSSMVETEYKITSEEKQEIINKMANLEKMPKFSNKVVGYYNEEGFKYIFDKDYWVMIRLSGTEPKVRAFAEMPTVEDCEKVIAELEEFYNLKK